MTLNHAIKGDHEEASLFLIEALSSSGSLPRRIFGLRTFIFAVRKDSPEVAKQPLSIMSPSDTCLPAIVEVIKLGRIDVADMLCERCSESDVQTKLHDKHERLTFKKLFGNRKIKSISIIREE